MKALASNNYLASIGFFILAATRPELRIFITISLEATVPDRFERIKFYPDPDFLSTPDVYSLSVFD